MHGTGNDWRRRAVGLRAIISSTPTLHPALGIAPKAPFAFLISIDYKSRKWPSANGKKERVVAIYSAQSLSRGPIGPPENSVCL
jgi:hypothetical protein